MFNIRANSGGFGNSVGPIEINDLEIDNVKHCGPLSTLNAQVTESMNVAGPVKIQSSSISNLTVSGVAIVIGSNIVGDLFKVAGSVEIEQSQLNCPSRFGSNNIKIVHSSTQEIHVEKDKTGIKEVLILDSAIVNGDIVFESCKGVVRSFSSTINGRVVGAELITVDERSRLNQLSP